MRVREAASRAPGAVDVLEEAMQVLTRLPAGDWIRYLAGAVPFLCAALAFGFAMMEPRYPEAWAPVAALVLAVLYIALNVARAAFAGQVRRNLNGTVEPAWTPGRVLRLVLVQTRIAAIRLWLYPLAMAALFPWSWAAAWLRTMTALNDTPIGVDWRQMRRAAGEQAGLWTGQGWRLLLLFGFAWVVLFVNIILALALLPMLLKSLTGQESWMSRLGGNLVGSMPFLWISIGLTWLVLDPLIQAAYVVRSFHGESLVTGEDLLARLRRLKQPLAAVILACCLAAAATPALADAVTGAELNQAIRKTLHTSEFEWMTRPAPPPTAETALERLARRVFEPFERAMDWAGGRIQEIFEWLREMLQTRSDIEKQPKVQAPGGLTLLLAAGGFVLLLAGAYLVLRNRRLRKDTRRRVAAPVTAVDLSDEDLDASRLPEQEWLVLASNLEAEGDLRAALRALYLSNLAWLSTAGLVVIHRAVTNGEYRREVARKARATPALVQAFGDNVRQFEAAWYGWHAVTGEDYAAFRDRTGQMKLAEVKR